MLEMGRENVAFSLNAILQLSDSVAFHVSKNNKTIPHVKKKSSTNPFYLAGEGLCSSVFLSRLSVARS